MDQISDNMKNLKNQRYMFADTGTIHDVNWKDFSDLELMIKSKERGFFPTHSQVYGNTI